jgi:hypothetical protein
MVQPKEEFYQANYPSCPHESYDGLGFCGDCETTFDWKRTEDPWFLGIGRVQETVTPRLDAPYDASPEAPVTLARDQQIQITGQYSNAFDQVWYAAKDDRGNTFYINAVKQMRRKEVRTDPELSLEWLKVQSKFFDQCRQSANDLGLTISSRCKLVVPATEKPEVKENKFKKFEKRVVSE